ncbi:hypothetical protein [Bordetella sp. FB-8]|uniref:hypothetical protein n=1 Tax=Bordetella sp. FB-8 TaxID=1159870 RepID=UPI0003775BBE|nr:hypothetical protein [Bordetella sp. FB-8]
MTFSKLPGKGRGQQSLDLRNADVGEAYMLMQQAYLDGLSDGKTPAQIARKIEKLQPDGADRRLRHAWAVAKKEIFADYELPSATARPSKT